jgi:hypothetical protein
MADIDEVIRDRAFAKAGSSSDYNNRFESFKATMKADGPSGSRSTANLKASNARINGNGLN